MIPRQLFVSIPVSAVVAGLVLGMTSCRKKTAEIVAPPAMIAGELGANGLAAFPGAVYHSQKDSPIHWQPWTPETMQRARAANRLLFGVIAMPQQPGFESVLKTLSKNTDLVAEINNTYVPVLIDGDAARETGILVADLCTEIKRDVQLPLFLWMSPDGNPVAWIPVPKGSAEQVEDVFLKCNSMVARTWKEDPEYVLKNSASDNKIRRERIALRKNTKVVSKRPAEDTLRGIRQLESFYDPDARTFDEAGGLFPSGALDLLATAAVHPGVPREIRARCLKTTRELLVDLLPSAMFDPLDGGMFSGRRGKNWAFPSFARDCIAQSRAVVALLDAYRATDHPDALGKALNLIDFAERSYQTSEGLFSSGLIPESRPESWLWSVEDIEKELPPEDAAWWIKATGMKSLGNLPFEVDPSRQFFRSNTLALAQSQAAIAAELSQPVESFAPRFEKSRKTLLKVREERLGRPEPDDSSNAAATFRMVSAYAAAFGATGDEAYRGKATALLDKARVAFSEGPKLRMFSKPVENSLGEGRAFLYALALQAAVDVATITSDEKWLVWSEDVATTAAELFTDKEFLKECPDDAKIIDLPVTDLVMLYDDSTAGLISFAECRLAIRGRPLVRNFSELATPLPYYIVDRPILHTDLMQATLAREFSVTVVIGSSLSPELKLATERLPMRMIQRRAAKTTDDVPNGSVKVILGNGESRVISDVADLKEAVLPSVSKS